MAETVIRVTQVSKKYIIDHLQKRGDGLRHAVENIIRSPLSWIRSKRSALRGDQEEFYALKDISFDVSRGEIVGVVGRNGAGKSTLLKLLSRITEPSSGRITIEGRVASLLEVGTGFHPELTGRENIYLNGAILGMSRLEIKRKFDEIVSFAEIGKFLDTPVKRYSSGMYVRLAFAVAAHLEPEILIVDEVLAVGDAQFQKKCMGKIQDVSKGGRTVLFVSHNMSAIRSLCTNAIMLESGRILEIGKTNDIVDRYLANALEFTGASIELEKLNRSGGFGTRLKVTHLLFNEGEELRHGEQLMIRVKFECVSDVEDVSFGVGFCNRDGVRIMSIDTDIPGKRINLKSGTSGTVSISVPILHMEPDCYMIDVGARSGDNFGLDYTPQCGSVSVVPSEFTPAVIAMRESGRGGWRQPAEYSVEYTANSSITIC